MFFFGWNAWSAKKMIGWINLSMEEFITESFGAGKWKEVLEKSKVVPNWISSCPYADKDTHE